MDRMVSVRGEIRVVVQARSTSVRLPGKVLLPLGGMPIVALAAKRAGNTGLPVVVATSSEKSDDELSLALAAHALPLHRGPLNDVLARFVGATADMSDGGLCIRLTADNVFPDGAFIETALQGFAASGTDYLRTSEHLPYGLVCEIFRVGLLRRAAAQAEATADREHVTPWIKRNATNAEAPAPSSENLSALRCTIDTPEDYACAQAVFAGVAEPVRVPTETLIERLRDHGRRAGPSLVLGTAQLGLAYGRTNAAGQPTPDQARALLQEAHAQRVRQLDTARAYGVSEERIGQFNAAQTFPFQVHTKLAPDWAKGPGTTLEQARASVTASLTALGQPSLSTVMAHRTADLMDPQTGLLTALGTLQAEGLIRRIGASVQSTEELAFALEEPAIEHIQLPANLLDRRFEGALEHEAALGKTLQARSVFLQGLLITSDDALWPALEGVRGRSLLALIDLLTARFHRADRRDLCVAFVRALKPLDGLVIGVATPSQLAENLRLFEKPPLTPEQVDEVREAFPALPEALLNPALWPALQQAEDPQKALEA